MVKTRPNLKNRKVKIMNTSPRTDIGSIDQ